MVVMAVASIKAKNKWFFLAQSITCRLDTHNRHTTLRIYTQEKIKQGTTRERRNDKRKKEKGKIAASIIHKTSQGLRRVRLASDRFDGTHFMKVNVSRSIKFRWCFSGCCTRWHWKKWDENWWKLWQIAKKFNISWNDDDDDENKDVKIYHLPEIWSWWYD